MKKRILAFICILSVMVSCVVFGLTANAAADHYQVGYAIKDMNPWVDYHDHSKGIQTGLFNLTGNGDDDQRPVADLFDDNGDGIRGEGDGLYTTATAVTDPFGKTVIYITIDSLQGESTVTNDVRTKIVERLGSSVISKDRIMVSASHSHSSAPFTSLRGKPGAKGEYYNYVISQITEAAAEAYADRAPADMSKGTVDAKEATAALGYNNGKGYHMNAIRHYEVSMTHKWFGVKKTYMSGSGDSIDKQTEYPFITSGANIKVTTPVEESDNDLHVLLFEFPDDAHKEPVVFVNWRAHTTMNSGVEAKMLSSDYVNGLRTALAAEGYRAAFFQGAAGNVVTAAKEAVWANTSNNEHKDWLNYVEQKIGSTDTTLRNKNKTYIYGSMLADIAQYCIEDSGKMQELPAGKIRSTQLIWHGELQPDSDGMRAAAAETIRLESAGETVEYPFSYAYEGEAYILNSAEHRNLVNRRANASADYTDMELNVIILGDEVAFVTSPNELADKFYTYSEGEKFSNDKNDWHNLVDPATFGTPFVLGYTNGQEGYIANWLDHTMNSQTYTDITGYAENGEEFFSPGNYESNTSRLAQGQGEELLKVYQRMINTVKGEYDRVAECKHCGEVVSWKPLFKENSGDLNWTGHCYLVDDLTNSARRIINTNDQLCLDLNGKKIEATGRTFATGNGAKNAVVSIMDSVGTGEVIGNRANNNLAGGSILIAAGNTLNIYGGTFRFNNTYDPESHFGTGLGGVMTIHGTLNMYGGTIVGAEMLNISESLGEGYSHYTGRGGAVYLGGALNISGGSILSGSVPDDVGKGPCVFLTSRYSRINLSGDAMVEDIYYLENDGRSLTISGVYTGTAGLTFDDEIALTHNMDIGNSKNAVLTDATITCTNNPEANVFIRGTNLRLSTTDDNVGAIIYGPNGTAAYDSLSDAVYNYNGGLIKLLKEQTAAVSITKDTYLDLAGFNISGKVTVDSGKTLYCMDSETDDYDVDDGKYGRLAQFSGTVAGVPQQSDLAGDGYLMITEEDGTSFHRVNLQLTAMTLRAEEAGVYYKSNFAGDALVARNVKQFGVALSIKQAPTAENIETDCALSWFSDFAPGINGGDATSTLLKGIMKQTNPDEVNGNQALTPIYGRAYILTNDGQYLFGETSVRTFRQQIEDVNGIWASLDAQQKESVIAMYKIYADVMKDWKIADIVAAAASARA